MDWSDAVSERGSVPIVPQLIWGTSLGNWFAKPLTKKDLVGAQGIEPWTSPV